MGEKLLVLDYLPNGSPLDRRPIHMRKPAAQGLAVDQLILLEVTPKEGKIPNLGDELELNTPEVEKIRGRLTFDKLTNMAQHELEDRLTVMVKEQEAKFVKFFNRAPAISTRLNSLELIPGIGKKHMWAIIDERREKPFESYADLQERVPLMPDPVKAIVKRILDELSGNEKYYIFVSPPPQKREEFSRRH